MEGLVIDPDFWKGCPVFVTGHTGFKGSWLCSWLKRYGANVTGYALAPESPSMFDSSNVARGMHSITGDIRSLDNLCAEMSKARPRIVLHLAAQALVRRGYREPAQTFDTNVMGTVNVIEAARLTGGVQTIVAVTSDKCYQEQPQGPGYCEEDRLGGRDPYSASKACAELVASAYRTAFFAGEDSLCLATVRAGNVIGGGDWSEDRLIPDFVRSALTKQQLRVRNPHAVRPWQHVLDPLGGYLLLAQRLTREGSKLASAWNLGPSDVDSSITVGSLIDRLRNLWGGPVDLTIESAAEPEAEFLKLDSSRARDVLGWRPRLPIDEALRWTVDWYQSQARGADMAEVTDNQIRLFCAETVATA